MIKMMFLVHKRPDLDSMAFRKYWRETHSQIASKIPGLRHCAAMLGNIPCTKTGKAPVAACPPHVELADWRD